MTETEKARLNFLIWQYVKANREYEFARGVKQADTVKWLKDPKITLMNLADEVIATEKDLEQWINNNTEK